MAAAIITGAASGIGRHFAHTLRRERSEMGLVLADRDADALARAHTADERTMLASLDVRDPRAWERTLADACERFGTVELLCNVAGIDRIAMLLDQPLGNIEELIDVNVKGALYGMRIVGAHMAAQRRGHIVNVGSLAGISPTPGTAIYSASKFALRGASLSAAVELRPLGVHVTIVCPDLVDTPLLEQHLRTASAPAAALAFSGPRPLRVEEVSAALMRALRTRPLEIDVPLARGLLARLAGAFPQSLLLLHGPLSRRGAASFERTRRERGA